MRRFAGGGAAGAGRGCSGSDGGGVRGGAGCGVRDEGCAGGMRGAGCVAAAAPPAGAACSERDARAPNSDPKGVPMSGFSSTELFPRYAVLPDVHFFISPVTARNNIRKYIVSSKTHPHPLDFTTSSDKRSLPWSSTIWFPSRMSSSSGIAGSGSPRGASAILASGGAGHKIRAKQNSVGSECTRRITPATHPLRHWAAGAFAFLLCFVRGVKWRFPQKRAAPKKKKPTSSSPRAPRCATFRCKQLDYRVLPSAVSVAVQRGRRCINKEQDP